MAKAQPIRTGTSRRGSSRSRAKEATPPAFEALLDVSFSDNLLYWTRLLETNLNRAFVARIQDGALSVSEWRILAWLSEKKSPTVGELAQHTHIERTVLVRLLDRMATKGLIDREPGTDRRVTVNRISRKGRDVFDEFQRCRDAVYRDATRGVPAKQITSARTVIAAMVRNLLIESSERRRKL